MNVSKKVKENILEKMNKVFNSKSKKKYLLLLITENQIGLDTSFVSNFSDYEIIGLIEKSKNSVFEKIKKEENDFNKEQVIERISYVN